MENQKSSKKIAIIFIFAIILIGGFFIFKKFIFGQGDSILTGTASGENLINTENIDIGTLDTDFFNLPKFKEMEQNGIKYSKIEDIKKGNKNPFKTNNQNANLNSENSNLVSDSGFAKLFDSSEKSIGVVLTDAEKQKCLQNLDDNKVPSDKAAGFIDGCFIEKRNKILE
jgi:hypothetical protein